MTLIDRMKNPATEIVGHQTSKVIVIPRLDRGIQKKRKWILWSSQRMTQGTSVPRLQGIKRLIIPKNSRDNNNESGIALVAAIIITLVVMMLIASLTYLFQKAFQTNVINRKFSTVYEAAGGGVEYISGIVNSYWNKKALPEDVENTINEDTFSSITNCTDKNATVTVTARTADGNYIITTTIKCLGISSTGEGGVFKFPPPPGDQTRKSIFYSITSRATEADNSQSVGYTEAIYRKVEP